MQAHLQAAATRGDVAGKVLRYGPSAAALVYPLALLALHQAGRQFLEAADVGVTLLAGLALCLAAGLVYGVPVLSFAAVLRSAGRIRRLAHFAFAAPPLFTLLGVGFFLFGLPNGEYAVWPVPWLVAIAYAGFAAPTETASRRPPTWMRTIHGLTGAAIVMIFLLWHLANHASAIWSPDANKEMMVMLRAWYRSSFVQPAVVALFAWQLATGSRLLWARTAERGDLYRSIQTASAGYLLVYIPSHLIAVFILGRWYLAIDTTFQWASGAPTGLLLDAWNVRLISAYLLAVLFVISHLAMGLRAVLRGHGVPPAMADRTAWMICSVGLAVSLLVLVAQLKVGG